MKNCHVLETSCTLVWVSLDLDFIGLLRKSGNVLKAAVRYSEDRIAPILPSTKTTLKNRDRRKRQGDEQRKLSKKWAVRSSGEGTCEFVAQQFAWTTYDSTGGFGCRGRFNGGWL